MEFPFQFLYEIQSVRFQLSGPPIRQSLGYLTPMVGEPVTLSFELNRPGEAHLVVNHQEITDRAANIIGGAISRFRSAEQVQPGGSYIIELIVRTVDPLSAAGVGRRHSVLWAGPISGMRRLSRTVTRLSFRSDLYWLHRLGIHSLISSATAIDQFQLCRQIVAQGLAGYNNPQIGSPGDDVYLPAGSLTRYWDPGVVLEAPGSTFGRSLLPGEDGENAVDPRQGRSVLEWLQFLAERDRDFRFSFETGRDPAAEGFVLKLGRPVGVRDPLPPGSTATRHPEVGKDRSDEYVIREDNVTEAVDLATSFIVEDWCNVVYATGEGSGVTGLDDDGRVFYYSAPGVSRDDFVDTRPILGAVYSAVGQAGLTVGGVDAMGVPDGSAPSAEQYTASVANFADSYAMPRNEPLVIPSGYRLRVTPDDTRYSGLLLDADRLKPGDTMRLEEAASFGDVGRARAARVSKMVYEISGGSVVVGVEFGA